MGRWFLGDNLSDRHRIAGHFFSLYNGKSPDHIRVLPGLFQRHPCHFGDGIGSRAGKNIAEEDDPQQNADPDHKHQDRRHCQRDGHATALVLVFSGRAAVFLRVVVILRLALFSARRLTRGFLGRWGVSFPPVRINDLSRLVSNAWCRKEVGRRILKIDAGIFAEFLQIREHGIGAGIAIFHIGCHSLHRDALEGLGDIGIQLSGRQRN